MVERLVAVQSQDYAAAKWAVGLRLRGATDAQVERAFDAGPILRTHVRRPTWHFVSPRDLRALSRFRATGNGLVGAVVVAGRVAGTRQRALGRDTVAIEARLLDRSSAATERTLRAAARRDGDFLGLAPELTLR